MKIIPLLIGVCLLPVLTSCRTPQTGEVIGAAEATVKSIALKSIVAKYPDVRSSGLKFHRLTIVVWSNGEKEIFVDFDLPASVKTVTKGKQTITTMKTVSVGMSPSGKVESVHKSTRTETYNAT